MPHLVVWDGQGHAGQLSHRDPCICANPIHVLTTDTMARRNIRKQTQKRSSNRSSSLTPTSYIFSSLVKRSVHSCPNYGRHVDPTDPTIVVCSRRDSSQNGRGLIANTPDCLPPRWANRTEIWGEKHRRVGGHPGDRHYLVKGLEWKLHSGHCKK